MAIGVKGKFSDAALDARDSLRITRHLNHFFLINMVDDALLEKLGAVESEIRNAGYYLSALSGRRLEDIENETHSMRPVPKTRDEAVVDFYDIRKSAVETLDVLASGLPEHPEARKAMAYAVQGLIVNTLKSAAHLRVKLDPNVVTLDRHRRYTAV